MGNCWAVKIKAVSPCPSVPTSVNVLDVVSGVKNCVNYTLSRREGTDLEKIRDVTRDTWKSLVMECDKPVLVEFWAPWCGPSCMILPIIGKLSKIYEGTMECYKLDTDEFPDIATEYGIQAIPTIMIFKNGEKKDDVIGAVPESTLVTCIEEFV